MKSKTIDYRGLLNGIVHCLRGLKTLSSLENRFYCRADRSVLGPTSNEQSLAPARGVDGRSAFQFAN